MPVPLPLSWNVTPLGRVPDSDSDGVGVPVVATVKLPAEPTVKAVPLPVVMVGSMLVPGAKATPRKAYLLDGAVATLLAVPEAVPPNPEVSVAL